MSDLEVLPEAEGGVRGQGELPLAGVVEDALVGRGDLEAAPVDVQHRTWRNGHGHGRRSSGE